MSHWPPDSAQSRGASTSLLRPVRRSAPSQLTGCILTPSSPTPCSVVRCRSLRSSAISSSPRTSTTNSFDHHSSTSDSPGRSRRPWSCVHGTDVRAPVSGVASRRWSRGSATNSAVTGPMNADVVVAESDLDELLASVTRAPIAAATLAVLLRSQTTLSVDRRARRRVRGVLGAPVRARVRRTGGHRLQRHRTRRPARWSASIETAGVSPSPSTDHTGTTRSRRNCATSCTRRCRSPSSTTRSPRSCCAGTGRRSAAAATSASSDNVPTPLRRTSPGWRAARRGSSTNSASGSRRTSTARRSAVASRWLRSRRTSIAHPDTLVALPEIGLGLIPGAGGTVSLTRRIGRQRTAALGLTGRTIDAATALDWGLVDEIATDRLTKSAVEWSSGSPDGKAGPYCALHVDRHHRRPPRPRRHRVGLPRQARIARSQHDRCSKRPTRSNPGFYGEAAALGWLGLHIPEEFGGSGYTLEELVVVVEEFGRGLAPGAFVPTVVASAVIAAVGDRGVEVGHGCPDWPTDPSTAPSESAGRPRYATGRCTDRAGRSSVRGSPTSSSFRSATTWRSSTSLPAA